MRITRLALLLAAYATTALGCADDTRTESDNSPVTGATAGNSTGGANAGGNGTSGAGTNGNSGNGTNGSTNNSSNNSSDPTSGNNMSGDDAMVIMPPDDCEDDPETLGNDCPGVVTCSASVDSCSLTTQNCCVREYNANAVSCNEGSECDGLVSAACDGPEDCPGDQLCCISVSVLRVTPDIKQRCVADANECKGGDLIDRILCHSDDDCGSNQNCEMIPNLTWWGQCK